MADMEANRIAALDIAKAAARAVSVPLEHTGTLMTRADLAAEQVVDALIAAGWGPQAAAGPGHHVLVTVDEARNNGRASISRRMVPIWSPAGLLRAGDSVEVVCEEFDLTEAEAAVIAALVEDFGDLDLGEENAPSPDGGCRPELVVVDGQEEVVRVVGAERMDDRDRAMLAELVAATKAYAAKHFPHAGVIQELLAAERSARRCIPNGVVQTRLGRHDGVAVKERLRAAVQAVRDVLTSPKDDGGENVDLP